MQRCSMLPRLCSVYARGPLRRLHLYAAVASRGATTTSISTAVTTVTTARRLLSTSTHTDTTVAAASTSPALSAQDFAAFTPRLLLRQALQQYTELDGTHLGEDLHPGQNHVLISRESFLRFCAQAHVEDPEEALAELDAAGVVVSLDGGRLVHLRPVLYLEALEMVAATRNAADDGSRGSSESRMSTPVGAFLLEGVDRRIADLVAQEEAMAERLRPAIARAAKWRRGVWGTALLFAGTQLAVVSRLTYFDLDWDIMEPVSYCVAIGTALLFYAYYLRYNEEHTYLAFDQRFLPRKVKQYAAKDFDWPAYEKLCAQLVEERAMRERICRWVERH